MEPILYVKKIVSLNPTKYKFFTFTLMLEKYSKYLFTIHDTPYKKDGNKIIYPHTRKESAKSFKQWLSTEI